MFSNPLSVLLLKKKVLKGETSVVAANDDASTSKLVPVNAEGNFQIEKTIGSSPTKPKSSLKSDGKKKLSRSV